jgi:hypothetical protein
MNTTIIRARYSKDGPECCLGKDNQGNNQVGRNRDACVAMGIVLTQPGKLAGGVGPPTPPFQTFGGFGDWLR